MRNKTILLTIVSAILLSGCGGDRESGSSKTDRMLNRLNHACDNNGGGSTNGIPKSNGSSGYTSSIILHCTDGTYVSVDM